MRSLEVHSSSCLTTSIFSFAAALLVLWYCGIRRRVGWELRSVLVLWSAQALQLYRIESLHLPRLSVTAAGLRGHDKKETSCMGTVHGAVAVLQDANVSSRPSVIADKFSHFLY